MKGECRSRNSFLQMKQEAVARTAFKSVRRKPSVDGLCAPAAARGAQEVSCRRARVGTPDSPRLLELPRLVPGRSRKPYRGRSLAEKERHARMRLADQQDACGQQPARSSQETVNRSCEELASCAARTLLRDLREPLAEGLIPHSKPLIRDITDIAGRARTL